MDEDYYHDKDDDDDDDKQVININLFFSRTFGPLHYRLRPMERRP